MKRSFISFIVALSVAMYSLCGFTVFADVTVPDEERNREHNLGSSADNSINQAATRTAPTYEPLTAPMRTAP